MVTLIIAEKPQVARDIARVMGARQRGEACFKGNNYWVSWCIGHIVELCPPDSYDSKWKRWTTEHLPMLPVEFKSQPIARTSDHFSSLKSHFQHADVTSIVNACDAGREGELIFRLVYEHVRCHKPVKRLWLSSLTDEAIKHGFDNLQPGTQFDALAAAARCRAEADWLVGMNATRALTLRNRRLNQPSAQGDSQLMSVGRVQTPTLAMLVRREDEIDNFVPEPYWQVLARFKAQAGEYKGLWQRGKQDRIPTAEEAERIATLVANQTALVKKVERKEAREKPPLLFDLTQLQRAANQRFGMSAQQTLDTAQALYEKHKAITYPRTDSNYLTSDMAKELPSVVAHLRADAYAPFCDTLLSQKQLPVNRRIVDDKEVGDHHAIIPTAQALRPKGLTEGEQQLLDLIIRRFLSVFFPDAVFATTRIDTEVNVEAREHDATPTEVHLFVTRGRVRLHAGWQEVEPPIRSSDAAAELPLVDEGETVQTPEAKSVRQQTKPPLRYNDALLLAAMERAGSSLEEAELRLAMKESGLGTPATRAAIIETLLRRSYLRRDGKHLVPTDAGRALVASVGVDSLKSAQLTGEWEAKLARVARGDYARDVFMNEVRALTAAVVDSLLDRTPKLAPAPAALRCPACDQGTIITGKQAWGCSRWRQGCQFVAPFTLFNRPLSSSEAAALMRDTPHELRHVLAQSR